MLDPDSAPRIVALPSAPRCRSTASSRRVLERGDFHPVHLPSEFGGMEPAGRRHAEMSRTTGFAAVRAPENRPELAHLEPGLAEILHHQQPCYERLLEFTG